MLAIERPLLSDIHSDNEQQFAGGWVIEQLWLFIVAPIVGAIQAGLVYKMISPENE